MLVLMSVNQTSAPAFQLFSRSPLAAHRRNNSAFSLDYAALIIFASWFFVVRLNINVSNNNFVVITVNFKHFTSFASIFTSNY